MDDVSSIIFRSILHKRIIVDNGRVTELFARTKSFYAAQTCINIHYSVSQQAKSCLKLTTKLKTGKPCLKLDVQSIRKRCYTLQIDACVCRFPVQPLHYRSEQLIIWIRGTIIIPICIQNHQHCHGTLENRGYVGATAIFCGVFILWQ